MTNEQIEAVARAIEEQLDAEDGWEVGTPQLKRMCEDFAIAAFAAMPDGREEERAAVVVWLRERSDKRTLGDAYSFAADAIERGEHLERKP